MAIVMVVLVTAVSLAQDKLIRSMKESGHLVKRWGGAILILVGIWLIVLAAWAAPFSRFFQFEASRKTYSRKYMTGLSSEEMREDCWPQPWPLEWGQKQPSWATRPNSLRR